MTYGHVGKRPTTDRTPQGYPLFVLVESRANPGVVFLGAVVAWQVADRSPVVAPLDYDATAGPVPIDHYRLTYGTNQADLGRLADAAQKEAGR